MDEERDSGNSSDRPKFKGDWECVDCKKPITELPFNPRPDQEVRCFDCYKASRGDRDRGGYRSRPKVQGSWQCAGCGKEITELPFNPRPGQEVFCSDCFRNNRQR